MSSLQAGPFQPEKQLQISVVLLKFPWTHFNVFDEEPKAITNWQ